MKFTFLEHTADIKFKAYGGTVNELFENAAEALSSYLSHGDKIKSKKGKTIQVSGTDYESLLYSFLDELIFLVDAENFVTARADVQLRGFNLKAELYGDETKGYDLDHIKAATYAEMYVKKTPKGWEAQVVLDV
ncbi:archease [Candidatus Pacearchaeota archaeon]|nr:archease [Candidatus Pacearchaeota archaeon]